MRRYERFIAEVRVGRSTVSAHCVNPGRMEGLVVPGARVWLSRAATPRALPWTWELMELDGRLVGANTMLPNRLVASAIAAGALPWLGPVERVQAEQAFGRGHRVDFLVHPPPPGRARLLEVKNCHLVYPDGRGYFPDSRSLRAVRHVEALARQSRGGVPAHVVFTVQRTDAHSLRPSALHAPDFARACRAAARAGVSFRALVFRPNLDGVFLDREIPVDLEPYDVAPLLVASAALDATSGWIRADGAVAGRSVTAGLLTRTARRAAGAGSRALGGKAGASPRRT